MKKVYATAVSPQAYVKMLRRPNYRLQDVYKIQHYIFDNNLDKVDVDQDYKHKAKIHN